MFGMSWPEIAIILAVGMFVLGPERIPVAVKWVGSTLKTVRTMAAGAQEQLRGEFGPELDELRRQIADLQSLKEIQELRSLRDLNPRSMITKNILGDEFSGGVKGLLGLDGLSDMLKPTGSGVAPQTPSAGLGKAVPFNLPPDTPPATAPGAELPVVNEPVVNEPVEVDWALKVNEALPPRADVSSTGLAKPEPAAAPRHAAPSSFDVDAT
jgi:sec-independent protein translocase protein TatB